VRHRPTRRHQAAVRDLCHLLHHAARTAGFAALPQINLLLDDGLTSPDITVVRDVDNGGTWTSAADAVLVADIMSPGDRRQRRVFRQFDYAGAGVGYFMRVDVRAGHASVILYTLVDGEYKPVTSADAGALFTMIEPFAFSLDPGALFDPA
jgi:putative restriction endonuclease